MKHMMGMKAERFFAQRRKGAEEMFLTGRKGVTRFRHASRMGCAASGIPSGMQYSLFQYRWCRRGAPQPPANRCEGLRLQVVRSNSVAGQVLVRVPLGEAGTKPTDVPVNVTENVTVTRPSSLLALIRSNPKVTIPQMAKALGVTSKTVKRELDKIKQDGMIKRVGPDKGGHWAVTAKAGRLAGKAKDFGK